MNKRCARQVESRLRAAAKVGPGATRLNPEDGGSFVALINGCSARVQLDCLAGVSVGGVTISLRHLSHETAEAVLRFLAQRNEPNGVICQHT